MATDLQRNNLRHDKFLEKLFGDKVQYSSSHSFPIINLDIISLKSFNDVLLAEKVIRTINSYGSDFIPDAYDEYQPLKKSYNEENIEDVLNVWMNTEKNKTNCKQGFLTGHLLMDKKRGSKISYHIWWDIKQQKVFHNASFGIDLSFAENNDNFNKFLKLCNDLMILFKPITAQIKNGMHPYAYDPMNLNIRYPELQWFNVFGKPYIDLFSKEKLLSVPCYKVHEISEDLIGIQLAQTPFDIIEDNIRDEVKKHLGEDAFINNGMLIHAYQSGLVPSFDFSEVLFDKNKPIEEPQIIRVKL